MPDSIYLLLVILSVALVLICWTYNEWAQWDEQRRQQRRVHRNLWKQAGQ
jgi:hypothetical protein